MTYSHSAPRNYLPPRHPYKVLHELRARRIALGLTQKQMAELLNAKQNQVTCWESGRNLPNMGTLVRWGRALGGEVRVEWSAAKPQGEPS